MTQVLRLDSQSADFQARLRALLAFETAQDPKVDAAVHAILADVKTRGDAAVLEYTQRFDKSSATTIQQLELPQSQLQAAYETLPHREKTALTQAAERVRSYHQRQKQESWQYTDADGTLLGQKITPLDRVGIYVPGGKAAYPSSVLMNAMPAQVAGVGEIIMVSPARGGEEQQLVLAAAWLAGVHRVFTIGGAQAVAALAYGTATIPQVDKIVGPGNAFVVQAKKQVFGLVDIDMMAGPSEILIIADEKAEPAWVAADLLSQAEHDEAASTVLITFNSNYAHRVEGEIRRQLRILPRRKIAEASIKSRSFIIVAKDLSEAAALSNEIAPEHLELAIQDPEKLLPKIRNAGAIFLGYHTPEACGDYIAGPSHVLPTAGSARFSSPLGVTAFLKTSSIIHFEAKALQDFGKSIICLAELEGLQAHAQSVQIRLKN